MALLRRMLRRKGFTLIELLVVIAIIALLAAILTPAISTALLRGRVTQLISNGRGIYTEMFAVELDNPLQLATIVSFDWPKSTESWSDSTDYFASLVTNDKFSVSYNTFAGPGMRPATTSDEFVDGELRNAWCIALDVSEKLAASTPILFTQNIDLNPQDLLSFQGISDDALPFGEKAAIIVTRGGSAFSIDLNTATPTNFNPVGATNGVLYPKNGQY